MMKQRLYICATQKYHYYKFICMCVLHHFKHKIYGCFFFRKKKDENLSRVQNSNARKLLNNATTITAHRMTDSN